MTTTFLDYLTLPNPETNSERCKEGSSGKITTVYGPYDVKPWTGVTWENLNASFGDVLRQKMHYPRVRDANDVDAKKRTIRKESSVTRLVENWNEPVVQHALTGTRKFLMKTGFKQFLTKGSLHFTRNTGEGDMPDEKGKIQEPDWCVYQAGHEVDGRFVNMVPGDSKPAAKWKAEWIESADLPNRRRAVLVMQQITKYMWLGKTRYGFVISEEELVPVRLSIFHKESDDTNERYRDYEEDQIKQSYDLSCKDIEQDEQDEGPGNQDITLFSYQNLGAPFSDNNNTIRTRLEYCRIPWAQNWTENDIHTLTINLTLWWLPLLALHDSSIKEVNEYLPLNELPQMNGLDNNPEHIENNADNETQGSDLVSPRKRKSRDPNRPERAAKSRRRSVSRDSAGANTSPRTGPGNRIHERSNSSYGNVSKQQSTFARASSTGPRRSRRKNKGLLTTSFSSIASSSRTTDVDESYNLSFVSSVM